MIQNFFDTATRDIFDGTDSKAARSIPRSVWKMAVRKLDLVNAATKIGDLRVPPGNKLEALKGDLAGLYSIRVNDQFRIVFGFSNGDATDVRIVDYH